MTGEARPLDPLAVAVLESLAALGPGRSLAPREVAEAYAAARAHPKPPGPEDWRRYLPAVRQQALFLARRGRILLLRRGKAVDPLKPVKGVVRLALPEESSR